MFDIEPVKVLEIAARVGVVYAACFLLLRLAGRRELAELSQLDLLVMLLVSETVSPALTGGDHSVAGGVVAAATLLALYVATQWLVFRSRRLGELLQGTAVVLIQNGRVLPEPLRKYRISDADLRTTLHEHGLLSVAQVKRAYIEPDGQITVIKRDDAPQPR